MKPLTALLSIAIFVLIFSAITDAACTKRRKSGPTGPASATESKGTGDTVSSRIEDNKKSGESQSVSASSSKSSKPSPPPPTASNSESSTTSEDLITAAQLDQANPDAADDSYCSSGKDQCSTNADAVGPLNDAIAKYKVTRRGEIVGVIANMLFESGAWSENINSGNSEGGQGTRCMMMWGYVSEYAKSLHPEEYATLMGSDADSPDGASASVRSKVMDLVLNPEDSFASGFWYLVEKASSFHGDESKLRDGNLDDFKDYVQNGIVTEWSTERENWWNKANQYLMV